MSIGKATTLVVLVAALTSQAAAQGGGLNLEDKTPLTIFLVNGVKLQGIVTWFDNFCVLLRRDGHSQLVYKHAISTVMPGAPLTLFEPSDEPAMAQEMD